MENTAIRGVLREYGLTIEQLAETIQTVKKNPVAPLPPEYCKEDDNEEE